MRQDLVEKAGISHKFICELNCCLLNYFTTGRSWSAARKGGGGDRERKTDHDSGDGWTTVGGGR